MGLFSSIVSGVKRVASTVGNTVSRVFGGGTTTQTSIPAQTRPSVTSIDTNKGAVTVTGAQFQNGQRVPGTGTVSSVQGLSPAQVSQVTGISQPSSPTRTPSVTQTNIPASSVAGFRLSQQAQASFRDITQQNKAAFGGFAPVASALDYATTAFAHPFKTVSAAVDPNKSVGDVVNNFYNQSLGGQIGDIAIAGASYISALLGTEALIAGLEAKGTALAAGQIIEGDAAKAAAGQVVKTTAAKEAGQVAVNTATSKAKLGLLQSIANQAKNPTFVLGALGTYAYTLVYERNPHGDAVQAIQIAMGNAQKAGDVEGYRKLKEYFDDLTNDNLLDQLIRYTPVLNVIKSEVEKVKEAKLQVEVQNAEFEKQNLMNAANDALLQKINAGYASDAEIEQYAKDNPYSAIAEILKDAKVREANAEANAQIYGRLDPVTGQYIPSPLELAKRQWNEEYYQRQQFIDGGTGLTGGSGGQSSFELPSTLNFGLLRTPGGYEVVNKDSITPDQAGNVVTDSDEIANTLFGVPYSQLTDIQKKLVDMMRG